MLLPSMIVNNILLKYTDLRQIRYGIREGGEGLLQASRRYYSSINVKSQVIDNISFMV